MHRETIRKIGFSVSSPVSLAALAEQIRPANDLESDETEPHSGSYHQALQSTSDGWAPIWMNKVMQALDAEVPPRTSALASQLGIHPAWLARAYRASVGEGLRDTLRRKRVECATKLLLSSDWPLADVAAAAGFCDQSHMNRAVKALIGKTPAQVRALRHTREVYPVASKTRERLLA